MSALTAIPGLNPEAIEMLEGAGILTACALARLSPVEAHRKIELGAWQRGKVQRAPDLATVQSWVQQATEMPGALEEIPAALPAPTWDQEDDIPEAIVLERATLPVKNVYVPPSQRARREAAGGRAQVPVSQLPAALPIASGAAAAPPMAVPLGTAVADLPSQVSSPSPASAPAVMTASAAAQPVVAAAPSSLPVEEVLRSALPGFNTFDNYQAGETRVAPLSRFSINEPGEPLEPGARTMERIDAAASLSRWVQRGVQHPAPGLLIIGALVSLLWRVALLGALIGLPWLLLGQKDGAVYRNEVLIAGGVLLVLGIAQLIVLGRARCRICSCHLFYSRNCVKNRKAHHIPLVGFTGSLALHLLLFQWFRCMYCGTAIRLWMGKRDR